MATRVGGRRGANPLRDADVRSMAAAVPPSRGSPVSSAGASGPVSVKRRLASASPDPSMSHPGLRHLAATMRRRDRCLAAPAQQRSVARGGTSAARFHPEPSRARRCTRATSTRLDRDVGRLGHLRRVGRDRALPGEAPHGRRRGRPTGRRSATPTDPDRLLPGAAPAVRPADGHAGIRPSDVSLVGDTPAAIGNRIAQRVLEYGAADN